MLRLYHGASLITGFVFFLTGAIELSDARREPAVKLAGDQAGRGYISDITPLFIAYVCYFGTWHCRGNNSIFSTVSSDMNLV